ncbi:MAG: virulence RhuM family protein [Candidatus Didemnitutus sp.]|nr:virulence RhuM family protein [Candidatus Didemnitutus sp.]
MTAAGSKIILYSTADGRPDIRLRAEDGSVWLSQAEIADLFDTSVPNVNIHLRNIFKDGELQEPSVLKESLITAADGKAYRTKLYNLEAVLAVGYRVKSPRGTQFRQWATAHLAEYLVKGFVLNDERLKNPGGWDYFDELLARIREIRASEKRFYQKVRDLFALSTDYAADPDAATRFFAEVQNKMLFAVTRQTAAELIVARADPARPNMALQTWSGSRVRKHDVIVAKNYLTRDEIDVLNRLVVMFLDFGELRTLQKQPLQLADWRTHVDRLLQLNERSVLASAGSVSHEHARHVAENRYEEFDTRRRATEALEADRADLATLEAAEKQLREKSEAGK